MEIWEELLEIAVKIIKSSGMPQNTNDRVFWSFGGGTAMMIDFEHRLSKDIDIFLIDRQLLGYFSPRLNQVVESEVVYYEEETEYIKLQMQKGEIDFISAQKLTDAPYKILHKFGASIPYETPIEIVAKKIFYRHNDFTLRDFFDLAIVIDHLDDDKEKKILQDIVEPYIDVLSKRLERTERSFWDTSMITPLPKGERILKEGKEILTNYFDYIFRHKK
ncbi:MAG: nucleotidyl transferase AbiEii/AbiGii toxin family protein [Synergistaceae bacterium]|nr:nucleotidyl transferase AbiEii/AbiGii toxin family protein [Synergistaceae bacterium]